ncbi:hypothetical protein NMY22_g9486 [Coprinellus aureogranulatus]|nr:hypothetical protein NMY22_g9486 [Coprinellus aureogranulatus]
MLVQSSRATTAIAPNFEVLSTITEGEVRDHDIPPPPAELELDPAVKKRIREQLPAERRWYRVTYGEVVGAIQGW